jgi:hypothetical protein
MCPEALLEILHTPPRGQTARVCDEAGAEMRQWSLRSAGSIPCTQLCGQIEKSIEAHVGCRASLGSDTTFQIRCQNVGTDQNGNGSKRVCHLLLGDQLEQARLERVEWSGENAMVVHESILTDFGALEFAHITFCKCPAGPDSERLTAKAQRARRTSKKT